MEALPPRSRKVIDATPLHDLPSGVKAVVEVTVYPDGHTGIAVSRVDGAPPNRRIVQADSLPLNDMAELRAHVLAVLEHAEAAAHRRGQESKAQAGG
jgi:hypothetical protein